MPLISTKNNDVRQWLNCIVNGRRVCLLLDTGSEVSLLNSRLFCSESPNCCDLMGAGRNKLICYGSIDGLFEICDDKIN